MNDTAKRNLETLRNSIAVYASFLDRSADIYGEIDDAVQKAEYAMTELLNTINRVEKVEKYAEFVNKVKQKGGTTC